MSECADDWYLFATESRILKEEGNDTSFDRAIIWADDQLKRVFEMERRMEEQEESMRGLMESYTAMMMRLQRGTSDD